jgi:radical SAM-linked protein
LTVRLEEPANDLFGRRRRKIGFTRRLAGPSLVRMRVRWQRGLSWRLYSHLDAVRAIERAIRRSGIPAAYSEGFHPRLKLAFGPPLSFGLISSAEYLDLVLEQDYEPAFAERVADALPAGISLLETRGVPAAMPALTDTINEGVFRTVIPIPVSDARARLETFHAQTDIRWRRPDRPDRKPVDPRKTLIETTVEAADAGTQWHLRVRLGGEGNLRPVDWAILLFAFTPDDLSELVIERTALLIRQAGRVRTPFEPI